MLENAIFTSTAPCTKVTWAKSKLCRPSFHYQINSVFVFILGIILYGLKEWLRK